MTPAPEAGTISVPANVTVSVFTVLSWLSKLDMVIAIELDAGRKELAKQISKMRFELAEASNLTRLLEPSPAEVPNAS